MTQETEMKVISITSDAQRQLLVQGLKALWRERSVAYNSTVERAAYLGRSDMLIEAAKAVEEVCEELRKWGIDPRFL